MLSTQKCLGGEGRDVQESIPCFLPWSTVPASPTLQAAARRVSACDKTCWAPALLSAGQEAGLTFQSSQGFPGHSSSPPCAASAPTPFSPKDSVTHQGLAARGWRGTPALLSGCLSPKLWWPSHSSKSSLVSVILFWDIPWFCGPSFCLLSTFHNVG